MTDRQPAPNARNLTIQEHEVLRILVETRGRVIGRHELARRTGLSDLGDRRCDSLLVGIRRVLGPDAIRTVRGRGWILEDSAVDRAVERLDARRAE